MCFHFDADPVEMFKASLIKGRISQPDKKIIGKIISNFSSQLIVSASSIERSLDLYYQVKAMPASITIASIQSQAGISVNGPVNCERPYLLSASDSKGVQLMVKILRLNPDNFSLPVDIQTQLLHNEMVVCELVYEKGEQLALARAEIIDITISQHEARHVGGRGVFKALKMLRYANTVTDATKYSA
jgi:hypothetical protein